MPSTSGELFYKHDEMNLRILEKTEKLQTLCDIFKNCFDKRSTKMLRRSVKTVSNIYDTSSPVTDLTDEEDCTNEELKFGKCTYYISSDRNQLGY